MPRPEGSDPALVETDELYDIWNRIAALHRVWYHMVDRCSNPRSKDYKNYGGRGIEVCARWSEFRVFLGDVLAEIGARPLGAYVSGMPRYTLDRIDVDKNYEPGNIRWATADVQLANRRPVRVLQVTPGQRFGRLEVVEETTVTGQRKNQVGLDIKHRAARCRCDCGEEATVRLGNLPNTASCGCLKRERMKDLAAKRFGPGGEFHNSGNEARRGD